MQYRNYPLSVFHRFLAGWRAFVTDPHIEVPLDRIAEDFVALKSNLNTRKAYRNDLRQFFEYLNVEGRQLALFHNYTKPELQKAVHSFLDDMVKRDILGEYVVNGWTLNRKLYTVAGFFRYLRHTYDFPFNPALHIPPYDVPDQSNSPLLTQDEIWNIMGAMKRRTHLSKAGLRNYLIILRLFHFALRRRELANLQWDHIHQAPIPHFRLRQKGNKFKYLPIPDEYMELLKASQEYYPSKSPFIFRPIKNNITKTLDKPITPEAIRKLVKRVGDEFVPDRGIVPHSFRATFITLARDNELDDQTILNTTGQADSRTLNFYDIRNKLIANAVFFFGVWIGQY